LMTSSHGLDPAELDRLLAHKRKTIGKKNKKSISKTLDDDEQNSRSPRALEAQDFQEINVQSDFESPTQSGLPSAHIYQWVVVMEHQRGFTLFKTPHYSVASLLPNDPPPFQVHDTAREKPWAIANFDEYTLPSPLWFWVSRFWMVDMRGDGEVDANGWQYSSAFTSSTWRSKVKSLNRGGWVRRRRWVRLMMKPATLTRSQIAQPLPQPQIIDMVWRDDVNDWSRCCSALKTRSTDGSKFELWKEWLLDERSSTIALNMITLKLEDILQSFIFPESRAHFLMLLRDLKFDPVQSLALHASTSDFWSYQAFFLD